MSSNDPLFQPYQLASGLELPHRIVMAPLTRSRATDDGMPTDVMRPYYAQRASAALIISEGIVVSPQGAAYRGVPGLFIPEQVREWKKITDEVHRNGGRIVAQLWHVGRQSHSSVQPDGLPPWAPSPIPIVGYEYYRKPVRHQFEVPRELTQEKISEIIRDYVLAAKNAIAAGFDGVELHGANAYLIDQFLNAGSNNRTDRYGGTIENRSRFLEEVVESIGIEIGINRVGVRLSPSSNWMDSYDPNRSELYHHVVTRLNEMQLAFLHLVEPGVAGSRTVEETENQVSNAALAGLFDRTVIRTGNLTPHKAREILQYESADLVGFGRGFISNPDLPERIKTGEPLAEARKEGMYQGGAEGYITYPTIEDENRWKAFLKNTEGDTELILTHIERLKKRGTADLALSGQLYDLRQAERLLAAAAEGEWSL